MSRRKSVFVDVFDLAESELEEYADSLPAINSARLREDLLELADQGYDVKGLVHEEGEDIEGFAKRLGLLGGE